MSELTANGIEGMISKVRIYDLDESIEASKFPMSVDVDSVTSNPTKTLMKLASCGMGEGHDNFLNGVRVAFNLTFTNKVWTEAERYHFFDYVSSQSTMHCITKFKLEKQCDSHVDPYIIQIVQCKVETYNNMVSMNKNASEIGQNPIYDKQAMEDAYLNVLMNIPAGFKLTARITTNYRQLKTIYNQRHNHRLPEWRIFCNWMIMKLPLFKDFLEGRFDDTRSIV